MSVLTRFWQGKHAVMAKIKQVCYEVKIPVYDMNALRFLWRINSSDVVE